MIFPTPNAQSAPVDELLVVLFTLTCWPFSQQQPLWLENCRVSVFNNTNQNDQGCVLFPIKKRPYAAMVSAGLLEKLCHTRRAAVRRCAVYIIHWQYALIFLFCSVTKFQNAACVLQTKGKPAVCQMYLDVMLILNKSSILNPYLPFPVMRGAVK